MFDCGWLSAKEKLYVKMCKLTGRADEMIFHILDRRQSYG